jgi:hypothetical protein
MPWARFDDHMPSHRKIRPLTDAAFRLWVSAVCWCNANKTDGFIGADDLRFVADVADPHAAVPQLTAKGLWEEVAGGWIVHDFHDYNPSVADVDAARKLKTARQQRWREKQRASEDSHDVDGAVDASTDASRDAAHARAYPVPTRPDPSPINNPPASAPPNADASKPKRNKRPPIEAPEQWEKFWAAYPRRKDKGAAEKAWNKAVRDGADPNTILNGVFFYRLDCANKEAQYIKYPATWLNARGWQDEPDPTPAPPRAIGAPSEAAAVQPPPFRQLVAEGRAFSNTARDAGLDLDDMFRIPE